MRTFLRNNGLTLTLMAVFLATWIGQFFTGHREYNNDQREHRNPEISVGEYMTSGHFWEATGENWESEFLQMAMFVILTCFLFQKGSPESKDPDQKDDPVDNDPRFQKDNPRAPWPVRKGGLMLWVYSYSLSICFALLFVVSILIHAVGGLRVYNEDQLEHGQAAVSLGAYLASSRFWFEALQNWQSEFLSLAAMVWLAVYLRQRGSAESKPVATPHDESGEQEPVIKTVPVMAKGRRAPAEIAGAA
jgi:succinate dehydrogenase hydrophobic anchor subunit